MSSSWTSKIKWSLLIVAVLAAGAMAATSNRWMPTVRELLAENKEASPDGHAHDVITDSADEDPPDGAAGHLHAADESAAAEASDVTTLQLSAQALATIGSDLIEVKLESFARSVSIPAVVVERPGRSQIQITAPFTGLVTKIYRVEGEAVSPGDKLFDLQLTHKELVEAQAEFLRLAEEIDVVQREITRLEKVARSGAIAGKTVLQRGYEKRKLDAQLHAQRQRLLLHRLSETQVAQILESRELLQHLTVVVPPLPECECRDGEELAQVAQLKVQRGQHVAVGDPLGVLTDHCELHIEGNAFEQDIPALTKAAEEGWNTKAIFRLSDNRTETVSDLKILYLASEIEPQSRALKFYVTLPNELTRDTSNEAVPRFIDWRFKPGQRLRLLVPIERSIGRIVLPAVAVLQDGAENYVFEKLDDHFDRRSVRVIYRDQDHVVIANDGTLKAQAKLAVSGAYQIYLAAKSKGGQATDIHAGHTH